MRKNTSTAFYCPKNASSLDSTKWGCKISTESAGDPLLEGTQTWKVSHWIFIKSDEKYQYTIQLSFCQERSFSESVQIYPWDKRAEREGWESKERHCEKGSSS
jgi:hypothetical protein